MFITSLVRRFVGNLSLWATLPFWFMSFIFYDGFEYYDPEGHVRDAKSLKDEYDFIVIGGGSAGAVVANRLSEVPSWNVLLLEAGGDESIFTDIPGTTQYLQRTAIDWQYRTIKQTQSCLGFNDQRGKVLGGSSVINYMLYVRGNKRDYDAWAALGNPGWSFSDVLPYFIKSEDNRNPYIAKNKAYHGTGGYLTVEEPVWNSPLLTAFIQAGEEMGYENLDGNAAKQTGFMMAQATNRRGSRCSTNKAFLRPIRHRKNLDISMHSHVLKINIDPATKRANSVRFEKKGKIREIKARKEIILSAGSVNSPQILMLSGVGPADHLNSLGIPVIADLRVGDNLQDHIALGGMVFTLDKPFGTVEARYISVPVVLNYTINKSGPLASLGGCEGLAWIKTKYENQNDDWPDVEFHFVSGTTGSDSGLGIYRNFGVRDDIYKKYYKPVENKDSWQVIPMLLRPKSKGTIRLASADPYTPPLIDPQYFTDSGTSGTDLQRLIEGTKIGLALAKTEAFRKLGTKFYDAIFPGCEAYTPWTDDYWGCFIKHFSATIYHPAGTCKMGPSTDKTAVVDPTLKVYGVKGLRVIDCSIMPNVVSGNTNAPTIMIGEKGADLVKADWPVSKQDAEAAKRAEKETLDMYRKHSKRWKNNEKKWLKKAKDRFMYSN